MPNSLYFSAEGDATSKIVQFYNPVLQTWVDGTFDSVTKKYTATMAGIPAGFYTGFKSRLKGSNPEIIKIYAEGVTVRDGNTTTPPTGTKATMPTFGTLDDVNNIVGLTSDYSYTEVVWGVEGGAVQQLASNSICSPGNIAGRLFAYVVANTAAGRLQSDTRYSAPFTMAAAANSNPTATISVVGGVTTVAPGQSVTLQLSGADVDAGDNIVKIEALDNGVKIGEISGASGSLQTIALTAGSHSFTAKSYDSKGATGLSTAFLVTAQAASTNPGAISGPLYVIPYGNSQTFGSDGDSWGNRLAGMAPAGIIVQKVLGHPGSNWTGLASDAYLNEVLALRDPSKTQIVLLQEFTNSGNFSYAQQKALIIYIHDKLKAAGFLVGLQTQYYQLTEANNAGIATMNQQVIADKALYCDIIADATTSPYLSLPIGQIAHDFIFRTDPNGGSDPIHFGAAGNELIARMWLDGLMRLKNGTYQGEVIPSTYVLPAYLIPTFNKGGDGDNTNNTFNPISISPTSGPVGTVFSISGTGLEGCNLISLSGNQIAAPYVKSLSNSRINSIIPQTFTPGAYNIYLITAHGSGVIPNVVFTVTAGSVPAGNAPTITSLSPSSAKVGDTVTVTGTYLTGASAVTLGSASATPTVVSSTQLTFVVPSGAATGKPTVTTEAGVSTSNVTLIVTSGTVTPSFTIPTSGLYSAFDTKTANYEVNGSSQILRFLDTSGNNRHALVNGTAYATLSADVDGNKRANFAGFGSYAFPYYPVGTDFGMVLELEFADGQSLGTVLSVAGYSHTLFDRNDAKLHWYTDSGDEPTVELANDGIRTNPDGSATPATRNQRRYLLDYRKSDGRLRIFSDGTLKASGTGIPPKSNNATIGGATPFSSPFGGQLGRLIFYDHCFAEAEISTWTNAPGL